MTPSRQIALRYALPGAGFVGIGVWFSIPEYALPVRIAVTAAVAVATGLAFFMAVEFVAAYVPIGGSDELPPSSLLREGPAAWMDGDSPRMGRLALTASTLTFFDRGLLSSEHGRVWNVADIVSIEAGDALHLTLRSGERVHLELPDVQEWSSSLSRTIQA